MISKPKHTALSGPGQYSVAPALALKQRQRQPRGPPTERAAGKSLGG